ncbi:hypothetical protein VTN49DRAFT_974 [Thermomyces lanuginosus]|uniref:uncharacterized protein n=1 Tax=Thermomyces lanuginosus TaxID=5541 RepID=UPI003743EB42
MAVATANDQKGTKGKGTEWEQRELPNRSSAVVMSPLEDDLWEDYYAHSKAASLDMGNPTSCKVYMPKNETQLQENRIDYGQRSKS